VVGHQVLDYDEGDTAVGRQVFEEFAERIESTG
jgi:hypothetical protein